jgi:phage shock protein A
MRGRVAEGGQRVAEPVHLRVKRVLSASLEDLVDAMERAGGASVMREAIRQVDRALDDVRVEKEAAGDRAALARLQHGKMRERIADLGEKARFALGKGRDDLAEAALASQLDLESGMKQLDAGQAEAAAEIVRLDACLAELAARKAQMLAQLASFEAARREAGLGQDGVAHRERRLRRQVSRAQETFDRVMANAGGVASPAAAHEAEIDALRRDEAVAERLAALRAGLQAGPARRRPGKGAATR